MDQRSTERNAGEEAREHREHSELLVAEREPEQPRPQQLVGQRRCACERDRSDVLTIRHARDHTP
jgi:hypothetical protein